VTTRIVLLSIGAVIALATLVLIASSGWTSSFGSDPEGARLERVRRSPNYADGAFRSQVPTEKNPSGAMSSTLRRQLFGKEQRVPPAPVPLVHRDAQTIATLPASGLRATWLGHATTLVEIDGVRLLLDPVWEARPSPSTLLGPKRSHPVPIALDSLPAIAAVVISHDHYDHLSMETTRALARAAAQSSLKFVVPLGVGAHLERWGIAPDRIVELDWNESTTLSAGADSVTLTAVPSRHFSGRGIGDLLGKGNPTLFASWVFVGPRHRAFFSGDTGFHDGFATIGESYGPFDLTIIKIGAYDVSWPDIHLDPEQAVRAHTMLRGRTLLPIHWATFNLAIHEWDEPAERLIAAAGSSGVAFAMPRPGEPIEPSAPLPTTPWWRGVRRP